MSNAFKPNVFRPKEFREDDELVLFGYVHEFESYFDAVHIPKDVIKLIILYYSWVDSWDIKYDTYFDINTVHKTIQRKEKYNCSIYSAFGDKSISTKEVSDNGTIQREYVWNFAIEAKGTDGRRWTDTIIGLINNAFINNNEDERLNARGWSDFTSIGGVCGFNTRNGQILYGNRIEGKVYAKQYHGKESDIICMLLTINDANMENKNTLKFFINGIDQGYAAVIPDGTYKLAISMAQPDLIKLF